MRKKAASTQAIDNLIYAPVNTDEHQRVLGVAIVVTGSSGFLGQHLIAKLNGMSKNTVGLDIVPLPENSTACPKTFYQVDPDQDLRIPLSKILFDNPVEAIVHLAAMSHLPSCHGDPVGAVRANVISALAVLETVRLAPLRGRPFMIFAGSGEEYGIGEDAHEQKPLSPCNIYAGTKAAAAMLIQSFAKSFFVTAAIIRFANLYGPGQGPDKFIPMAINKMLLGNTLTLHNSGRAIRDWVYVDDAVEAIVTFLDLERFLSKKFSEYRVTGEGADVGDVAKRIRRYLIEKGRITDAPIALVEGGALSGTVFMRDDPRLQKSRTRLDTGLPLTIDSYIKDA